MYLPQYHTFKENDEWWGKGYTEWTAVKRAKKLYKNHIQPRIPKNGYYDLNYDFENTLKMQSNLMKKYNIYALCFYHYWFNGKILMGTPMEKLLENTHIDLKYTICWANETWTRTWYDKKNEILMEQTYGDELDWTNHYNYLSRFFKDKRYLKIDNKPVLHIYKSADIECLAEMRDLWNTLAIKDGFDGIYLVVGNTNGKIEKRTNCFDAYYNFEPGYSICHKRKKLIDYYIYLLVV